MSYEEAMRRAEMASSFVEHPYWKTVVVPMLSGTIQQETEQMLATDDHIAINRASVAICRKVIQAPFFDMEQGRLADSEYQKAQAHLAKRRGIQSGPAPHEVM